MAATPLTARSVLKLETERTPTQITIRCFGRAVSETCEELESTVRKLLRTTPLLLLDFAEINYVDSSALGALVGLYISCKRAGCTLKLINLTQQVKKLMNLTHLADVLEGRAHEEMFGYPPH